MTIDGEQLRAEPGQNVVSHGPDRGLTTDEITTPRSSRDFLNAAVQARHPIEVSP